MAAACALGTAQSHAQSFPTKPIRLVVPYSPGAASDVLARAISGEMGKALGQPVVIENRPGGDTLVGSEYVAKQVPADGYTVMMGLVGTLASLPVLTKDIRFDPLKDLVPVAGLAEGKFILVSASTLPWKSFNELVANAKANPGKLNYGVGTALGRLLIEAVMGDIGVKMEYVPYSSVANYLQGLTTADIHIGLVSEQLARTMGDKLRVLAVTGDQRSRALPDAPTFKELGFPKIRGLSFALMAPAGVPASATEKLYAAASKALQQPEVLKNLATMQLDPVDDKPDAAARKMAEEGKLYSDVGKQIQLKPQ